MYNAEPGDILLYRTLQTFEVREIDWVERLKDGRQHYFYYHSSIALDAHTEIESNGKTVAMKPLAHDGFDVFRPPVPVDSRDAALRFIRTLVGQRYDWVLVFDDVLRAITHDLVHLPVSFVESEERHRKICSSLVVKYLNATGLQHTLTRNALPEDIYIQFKDFQVRTD
jgi:hypothetical protein